MEQLRDGIDSVGYLDWNIRDFHSYDTVNGTSYNSYLIRDEKTALIDTVKAPYASNLLENIRQKTDLSKVDYVVCNHSELDHAGALPEVMKALPNATLLCNVKCRETLAAHFDISSWKMQIVGPEDKISLGTRSLVFVNVPMLHWPESMVTYMPEEKILFSNDSFGQHIASLAQFDDNADLQYILHEAKSYYANIVTPYGRQVLKTLEAVKTIPITMIAPSHGFIWRKHIPEILAAYEDWASGRYKAKVVILYDSMWESTTSMASAIAQAANEVDNTLNIQLRHVRKTPLSRIATELLDTPVIALGSATLNTQMMPQMSAVLTYIKGLKFREKSAMAFGSAGWGPGGAESLAQWIQEMKYPVLCPVIKAKYRPTPDVLHECRKTGEILAKAALEKKEID